MQVRANLIKAIKEVSEASFMQLAYDVFQYQIAQNRVFKNWYSSIQRPFPQFLPIAAFKHHDVICNEFLPESIFYSSGTTKSNLSKHLVKDLSLYHDNAVDIFEAAFGSIKDYTILALLPHYLERSDSSLISMVDYFMKKSDKPQNGYYLYNFEELYHTLTVLQKNNEKTLLFGVSFALLDFAERYRLSFPKLLVIETGGMKGRGKEIPREELHAILSSSFGVDHIHSEYGMTELLSQCYSKKEGIFEFAQTMKIFISEINDPFNILAPNKTGIINIIDLANIDSCSFIKTDDLGMIYDDNTFSVLGRMDHSDVRGCNLMIEDV